ncbi:MAG TPA: rod shape-determining protein MreC [Candidatus Competibacteraceae bacterium]|nr:rod shape-determining protein MreC [Candidatus Competibacteraceae bacterium]
MARIKPNGDKPLFAPEASANVRVVVFLLASLALMTLDQRYQQLERLRDVLSTLLYPVQYAMQLPFSAWEQLSRNLASREALVEENQQLKQKQLFLNAQLQRLAAIEAENRRLRMLLESSVSIKERVLIAELLTVDFDPYRHQILLNKGRSHGVYPGQPLLDQQGVIGQIIHANTFTSTAILITDPNHALPVQVNRNGLRTLAVGTGKFQELELPYIPNNDDIEVGDLLVTSGLGGRFPRGYPVARVTKVEFDPGSPFAKIVAQPTTQLDRIREVLLVVSDPEPEADSMRVGPYKAP